MVESVNSGTDQWAIALTNTVPASKAFTAGTTDLATANGYTAGGNNVSTTSSGMNGSDYVLVLADPAVWTASGAGFTFRYALLVNRTVNIIPGYWDYGAAQAVQVLARRVAGLPHLGPVALACRATSQERQQPTRAAAVVLRPCGLAIPHRGRAVQVVAGLVVAQVHRTA